VRAVITGIGKGLGHLIVVLLVAFFNFIMQSVLGVYSEEDEKKSRRPGSKNYHGGGEVF
jgi:hypothetical protein